MISQIVLGIALASTASFAPSLFAQTRDANDCKTQLATFVREIANLLAHKPNNLNDVFAVLYRYFPVRLHGCTADLALGPLSKSSNFKGATTRDRITSFSLASDAATFRRGGAILISVDATGDWDSPFVIWSPAYP